jgi:hypothetical protein
VTRQALRSLGIAFESSEARNSVRASGVTPKAKERVA